MVWFFFCRKAEKKYIEKEKGIEVMDVVEHVIEWMLEVVVPVLELMGIFIVAEAALMSFARYLYCLCSRKRIHVKGRLAAGLLLGLEFMMTAEILKTIVIRDTKELLILGGVVVLRVSLLLSSSRRKRKSGKRIGRKRSFTRAIPGIE